MKQRGVSVEVVWSTVADDMDFGHRLNFTHFSVALTDAVLGWCCVGVSVIVELIFWMPFEWTVAV